jgi:serine/threonine protein kinase
MKQALETGTLIDGFLIGEKLHVGGMASLWSVTRPDIDTPIVMKVPTIMDGEDAEVIVGFEMEMMILPRLTGPHVPRVFGVGDYASQPYIVMEYIDGQSLFPLLEQSPLPADQVIALAIRIANALRDLHRQNVIHFDLKPSNIMQRKNGEITFIDFGLSRHLQLPDLLEEEFHIPMGTGPYISPEQVLQNRSDSRSDLFSLGVILYHLVTGQRPFGFPQSANGLRRRLWRDPIPPRQHIRDIPMWFQEVILRCLEPDPERRYPTAAQLAFDIQNPGQVQITDRGERLKADGFFSVLKRRMGFAATMGAPHQPDNSAWLNAPIVVVAIDLTEESNALAQALRMHAANVLARLPGARLACVNVLKQNRLTMSYALDDEGRNLHVQRLVELKEWARPLGLAREKMTFHVLEHVDPAAALLEYTRSNHVDHILLGAQGTGALRRFMGSVSSQIVAEAPCSVTVVRVAEDKAE